jgi:hypothetical protein
MRLFSPVERLAADFFVGSGEQDATDDPIQAFNADGMDEI